MFMMCHYNMFHKSGWNFPLFIAAKRKHELCYVVFCHEEQITVLSQIMLILTELYLCVWATQDFRALH